MFRLGKSRMRRQPRLVGVFEIALLVVRRDARAHPPRKAGPGVPVESGDAPEHFKHRDRRLSAGNRQLSISPSRQPAWREYTARIPLRPHRASAAPSLPAPLPNTTSGPVIASSARITASMSSGGSTMCDVRGPQQTSISPPRPGHRQPSHPRPCPKASPREYPAISPVFLHFHPAFPAPTAPSSA